MLDRYDLKPEHGGWTVIDIWTGEPVVLGGSAQVALDLADAEVVQAILNEHARRGARTVLQ